MMPVIVEHGTATTIVFPLLASPRQDSLICFE